MNTIELLVVLLDVAVLGFSAIAWARWRAAERPRRAIIAQYQRPHGLDIVQASVLIGRESVAPQAAILDLAVRGRLRIVATPVSYVIELLSIDGLSHNEGRVVNILFGQRADPGAVRYVPRRDRVRSGRWTRAESRIRAGARRGMAALGLIRPPGPTVLAVLSFFMGLVTMVVLIAAISGFTRNGISAGGVIAVALTLLATVVAYRVDSRRTVVVTETGRPLRDHLLGMRLYLTVAETDRMRVLHGPDGVPYDSAGVLYLFERLLPWAVLWGVEREWAAVVRRWLPGEPAWWTGDGDVLTDFGASYGFFLGSLTTSTESGDGGDGQEPGDPSDSSDGSWGDSGGSGDGGGGDGGGGGGD